MTVAVERAEALVQVDAEGAAASRTPCSVATEGLLDAVGDTGQRNTASQVGFSDGVVSAGLLTGVSLPHLPLNQMFE